MVRIQQQLVGGIKMKWILLVTSLVIALPSYADQIACYYEKQDGTIVFSNQNIEENATRSNLARITRSYESTKTRVARRFGEVVTDSMCVKAGDSFGSDELDEAYAAYPK